MVLLLSERIIMTADNHRDYDISREALGLEGDTPKDDKHIEAVAQGTKVSKSKSKARQIAEIFVGGDLKETAVHVRDDVAIPASRISCTTVSAKDCNASFGEKRETIVDGIQRIATTSDILAGS